ncbi:MAG: amidohydrolase family protein [Planctomycetota bacterium]
MRPLPTALVALCSVAALPAQQTPPLVIEVGRAWLEPGKPIERPRFVIEVGRIRDVATWKEGQDAAGAERFAGAVATAGFVDLHRLAKDQGELGEKAESLTPELRLDRAYDPFDPEWKRSLAKGVTSFVLAPAHDSLSGGQAIWVTNGLVPEPDQAPSYIGFSLTKEIQGRDRRPTSLIGALDYLREGYRRLRSSTPRRLDPTEQALASTLDGAVKVGFVCAQADEVLGAMTLAEELRLEGTIFLGDSRGRFVRRDVEELLPKLRESGLGVALPCLSLRSDPEDRALPAELDRAGIRFAFWCPAVERGDVEGFQWTLAASVRRGLDPARALAAVTSVPASWAGVGDVVGTLYKGRQADLCVWSGDPWDLRSRLLLVVRKGEVVWRPRAEEAVR